MKRLIKQQENKTTRQRKAAAVIYLCYLFFNNASVLQGDWLLFRALCCQTLACRAKHIAEKDLDWNIKVLSKTVNGGFVCQ